MSPRDAETTADTGMAGTPTTGERDPRRHTANIKAMLRDVIDHARQDVGRVDDPKAQALFETTAEVLQGLVTAYDHYERRQEPGWR